MNFKNTLNAGLKWCNDHSAQIFTGLASVGVVATGILAFRAGTKATHILEEAKEDWADIYPEDKETKRIVIFEAGKKLSKFVIPAIASGVFTIVCCIKSQAINAEHIAAITSWAGMSAKQLSDINTELEESFGPKKAKEIRSKAMQRRYSTEHPNDGEECKYLIDCGGDVLCCDIYGDVYFTSTHERVKQAIENLGYQCADETTVTLNDLYLKLGVPPKNWAYLVIWNSHDLRYETDNFGTPIPKLPIEMTTIMGFNGKPCIGIRYDCDSVCY